MSALFRRPGTAAAIALAATVLVLACLLQGIPKAIAGGDAAMTELYTLHASQGIWLYGPYSRFGWHHPGPLLFYLYAPWYALTGHHPAAINASALLINVTAAVTILWLLARRLSDTVSWALLAATALFVWRLGGVVSSAWNPHVLILPFTAMLMCAAAVAAGQTAWMAVMIAAASLVVQSHLGLAPVVGVTVAIALAAAAAAGRRDAGLRRASLLSAAVALLLWLPVMIEAAGQYPGNPARIYAFISSAAAAGRGDAWLPLWAWADLVTAMWSGDPLLQSADVYTPVGGSVALAMAVLQTLALPLVAWWALNTGRWLHGWLAIIVAAASLTALWALQRHWQIEGTILMHTSLWIVPIGVLNLAVFAAAVAAVAAPAVPSAARLASTAFAPAWVAALALLVAWGGYQFHRHGENTLRSARHPTDIDRVVDHTAGFLRARGLAHPLVIVDAPVWHLSAAVVLHFARSGVDVAVQPGMRRMFGAPLVKDTARDVMFRIVDRSGAAELERDPASELVLARDSVLVYALPPAISPVP